MKKLLKLLIILECVLVCILIYCWISNNFDNLFYHMSKILLVPTVLLIFLLRIRECKINRVS